MNQRKRTKCQMISHWAQCGVQAGLSFPSEEVESTYPIHTLHPLKVQSQERRKNWSCLVTKRPFHVSERKQNFWQIWSYSLFLISILTFGLSLRQLEDEYEIILINIFLRASFLSGSELWINSFHSCWDNRLFSLAAWWDSEAISQD